MNAELFIKTANDLISAIDGRTLTIAKVRTVWSNTVAKEEPALAIPKSARTRAAIVRHLGYTVSWLNSFGRVCSKEAAHAEALVIEAENERVARIEADRKAGRPVDEEGNDTREWCGNDIEAAHAEALAIEAEPFSRIINIADLPCMDDDRAQWLKNRWSMFWEYCEGIRASMIEAAHDEALAIEADWEAIEQVTRYDLEADYDLATTPSERAECLAALRRYDASHPAGTSAREAVQCSDYHGRNGNFLFIRRHPDSPRVAISPVFANYAVLCDWCKAYGWHESPNSGVWIYGGRVDRMFDLTGEACDATINQRTDKGYIWKSADNAERDGVLGHIWHDGKPCARISATVTETPLRFSWTAVETAISAHNFLTPTDAVKDYFDGRKRKPEAGEFVRVTQSLQKNENGKIVPVITEVAHTSPDNRRWRMTRVTLTSEHRASLWIDGEKVGVIVSPPEKRVRRTIFDSGKNDPCRVSLGTVQRDFDTETAAIEWAKSELQRLTSADELRPRKLDITAIVHDGGTDYKGPAVLFISVDDEGQVREAVKRQFFESYSDMISPDLSVSEFWERRGAVLLALCPGHVEFYGFGSQGPDYGVDETDIGMVCEVVRGSAA